MTFFIKIFYRSVVCCLCIDSEGSRNLQWSINTTKLSTWLLLFVFHGLSFTPVVTGLWTSEFPLVETQHEAEPACSKTILLLPVHSTSTSRIEGVKKTKVKKRSKLVWCERLTDKNSQDKAIGIHWHHTIRQQFVQCLLECNHLWNKLEFRRHLFSDGSFSNPYRCRKCLWNV